MSLLRHEMENWQGRWQCAGRPPGCLDEFSIINLSTVCVEMTWHSLTPVLLLLLCRERQGQPAPPVNLPLGSGCCAGCHLGG